MSVTLILLVSAVLLVGRFTLHQVLHPLRRYPGPWLAGATDAWRFIDVVFGMRRQPTIVGLHKKHGDIVRIGPNHVSFACRDAIRDIYGVDKPFRKSELYWMAAPSANGRVNQTLFSSTDVEWHDSLRSTIQPVFKLSELTPYESEVEDIVKIFLEVIGQHLVASGGTSGIVDLSRWFRYFASDVLGRITNGREFGTLREGSDVDDIMAKVTELQYYTVVIGQMPVLDKFMLKNPILLWLNRRGLFNGRPHPIVNWAVKAYMSHKSEKKADEQNTSRTLLGAFSRAKDLHPNKLNDAHCISLGISMVVAGSESTAILLTAFIYFVLKDPEVYVKLQAEIDRAFESAGQRGAGLRAMLPWRAARDLPYLDACIKESFRMHPPPRFSLERVLPVQGAVVAGERLPGGTIVSVHPWAIAHNAEVFGRDVDTFRPERWLPQACADLTMEATRIRYMNGALMHFGQGRYSCIGKEITMLECHKLLPTILRDYKLELADPEKTWSFEPGGFINVSGVDVRFSRREKT